MSTESTSRESWLVAAWPGMGSVAVGAAAYLITKLGARLVHELPAGEYFDLRHIEVKAGLAVAGRLPRSMFFEWRDPKGRRDLLVFLGEEQPASRGYAFCRELLDFAAQREITRVYTFAAMATQLHPSHAPHVYGVATSKSAIDELYSLEATILDEGQISGMNGVLLAAAAERALVGVCLLGEIPYFAAGVPNPKASKAVLELFATAAGVELDFTELAKQAEVVDRGLLELLEKMQAAARMAGAGNEDTGTPGVIGEDSSPDASSADREPTIDYATRVKIEHLFDAARQDRAKAVNLKQELDRLGVFRHYEDRFLDLFKKAE